MVLCQCRFRIQLGDSSCRGRICLPPLEYLETSDACSSLCSHLVTVHVLCDLRSRSLGVLLCCKCRVTRSHICRMGDQFCRKGSGAASWKTHRDQKPC